MWHVLRLFNDRLKLVTCGLKHLYLTSYLPLIKRFQDLLHNFFRLFWLWNRKNRARDVKFYSKGFPSPIEQRLPMLCLQFFKRFRIVIEETKSVPQSSLQEGSYSYEPYGICVQIRYECFANFLTCALMFQCVHRS